MRRTSSQPPFGLVSKIFKRAYRNLQFRTSYFVQDVQWRCSFGGSATCCFNKSSARNN
ncbi:unnamed protein product [Urochloa humidicola]